MEKIEPPKLKMQKRCLRPQHIAAAPHVVGRHLGSLLAGTLEDCHEFKTEPTKPNLLVRSTFLPTFCPNIDPRIL